MGRNYLSVPKLQRCNEWHGCRGSKWFASPWLWDVVILKYSRTNIRYWIKTWSITHNIFKTASQYGDILDVKHNSCSQILIFCKMIKHFTYYIHIHLLKTTYMWSLSLRGQCILKLLPNVWIMVSQRTLHMNRQLPSQLVEWLVLMQQV